MSSESTSGEFLERIQKLSPKRLALLAAELERRLAARETNAVEPIAVIGLGCRMPGPVDTPGAFWDLLANGVDAIEEVPSVRWDAQAFYDPRPGTPGKTNSKWGGFVANIDTFDAAFFGISPKEAVGMDPQQRILLEVSWEALEHAGVRADALNGTATGVFVGMSTSDYASLLGVLGDPSLDAYSGSGVARSVAAGRLSYFLGLKGPNLAVDTACSSSAVALHLACQSLRQKECRIALAGGVNALLVPQVTITLAQAHMLAGDGRCKTFSQSADGFVRSEGGGMLVLKRLSDAQQDGDRILGIIRGSAMNHDGRSSGLTAPNGPSQEEVIRAALKQAGVEPEEVDYVETHGTGTVLGDAIELGALGTVFGTKRTAAADLLIGSVKTNIGHMEAAAGAAGVIKVLLALEHECIPPHLHVAEGHENEALRGQPMKIPQGATPWSSGRRSRIAGVSSFGFSGTNAHIVIEEASLVSIESSETKVSEIITVSAKDKDALLALCARHAEYLRRHVNISLADFAFTLNAGRSHFQHRVAFVAGSIEEAASQLESITASTLEGHRAYRFIGGYEQPSIGFLFTGQGSQYAGMARSLYAQSGAFRSALDECDRILAGKLAHPLSAVLCGDSSVSPDLIHETAWTQPALFAFEYALAMHWQSWGVQPSVVLGHSLGEYVAACIAGVFSLAEALTLAYERGRLMGGLPAGGAMLAVRAGEHEVAEMIQSLHGLSIAAMNGPKSAVVSGVSEQVEQLQGLLAAQTIVSQRLTVSHAFHSALMDPILDEFEREAAKLTYRVPRIPMVSNVSGRVLSPTDQVDASYWRRHVRDTVRFSHGISALMEQRPVALLEIGPDPVLLGMAKPALPQPLVPCLPSLRRGKEAEQTMHEALRELYLLGAAIDWNKVYSDRNARKLALPTYPFQRKRYWVTPSATNVTAKVALAASARSAFDPLLYTTEWQTVPRPQESRHILNPDQLLDAAVRVIEATTENREKYQTLAAYSDFLPRVDRLCTTYILETLSRLGLEVFEGARVSRDNLLARLHVRSEYQRLVDRFFAILEEDGAVSQAEDAWVFQNIPAIDSQREHASLVAEFPAFSAELNFLAQASHLPEVMQGHMSPLDALFPNGSFSLAEQIYRDAPASKMFNLAMGEVVKRAVEAYSPDKIVKITEVGAGTGSTTSQVLPLLDGSHVEYLFTDVSPAFCDAARRTFANFPFVRYAALDLESEGGGTLTAAENSDIVVAANVLHATTDIKQTLQRIRRMLRPDGALIIFEMTAPQRFGDLTTGMTRGWWHFKDASLRGNYPLVERRQWIKLLNECGFRCSALAAEGPFNTITQRQTILVAQPQETPTPQANAPSVLLVNGGAMSQALSPVLQSAGCLVSVLGQKLENSRSNYALLREWLRAGSESSPIVMELAETGALPECALNNAVATLELLQAVVAVDATRRTVWLVTFGASSAAQTANHLSFTTVEALAKTARLEHPELSIRCVDLPSIPTKKDLARLSELIREGVSEHSLAIREGEMVAPRLVSLAAVASRDAERCNLSPYAIYLVTGAYGGLGFRTVQWMVERGATSIVMVGRREPSSQIREQIAKFREAGVHIYDLVGDVSVHSDVERIFQQISQTGLDLRGIIHAAGTVKDGTLLQQTREQFASVFKAKVDGGWLLHEFSRKWPLDFFVLYGSAASVLGSAGQSNHSAANGFLDGLSRLRRSQGLPATTIAWGAWSEIGAASHLPEVGRAATRGLSSFSPEKGIELLEQAILCDRAEVAALPIDWHVYLSRGKVQCDWPLFAKLPLAAGDDHSSPDRPTQDRRLELKYLLEQTPSENRLQVIAEYLRPRVAEVLRLDYEFREDQAFAELGLDSLMALELKNELQVALGITLPGNFFFEYPSLNLAATFVNARLAAAEGSSRTESDSSTYEELTI